MQQAILIVAQSGRFLAQIAHRAGYLVWVADCFGDQDTLAIAQRWLPLPELNDHQAILNTLAVLSQNQACLLLYGSGVEAFFPVLNRLPKTMTLLGNSPDTIEQIKTPSRFFSLLQTLSIPYPDTHFSTDGDKKGRWLCKPNRGFGGQFIAEYDQKVELKETYYQRYIQGSSGSVLFLAHGKSAHILCFNQQFNQTDSDNPFLHSGLSTPFNLPVVAQKTIKQIVIDLVANTDLSGFNSLDFIMTPDNTIFVLEVNPRISASVELLDDDVTIMNHHIAASTTSTEHIFLTLPALTQRHLHVLLSPFDLIIPHSIDWPAQYHDIPKAGTLIKAGSPLCSAIVETPLSFKASENKLWQSLLSLVNID